MQAYQIPLKGASDASNILFTVSRDTGVGLDTVSQSLARARAAMGAAAPPLATMGGLMLDLTQHGETGRQAISTLTSAFTGIISPTAAVTAAQAAMGVSFINAKTGGLDPMSQIFSELQPKLAGMSPTMAAATLKTLGFGSASAKLAETIQAGPAVLDKYTASVTAAGAAHDAAAKQADTMKGELEKLKSGAGDLMTELGTVLVPALTAVVGALLSVATWVGTVIPVIAKFVTGVVNSAIVKTIFTDIATAVGKAIAFISSVIGTVTSWIKDHWTQISTDTASAWAVISNILTVAWNIISKIIQFAVAVIVPLLQTTWSIISTAVSVAWNIISTIIGTAITVIIAVISTIVKIISFLVGVWQTVTSDVSNFIGGVVNFFIALPGRIMGAISGIYNTVGGFLSGVWSHISTDVGIAIGDVVNWFLGMPGKIVGALGNLGNLLFNIGASIIGGLLNGIKSALNDVKNFVSGIAGKIMSWKGPLDYDATILVPHGNAIMAGLVAGIQQGLNGPVKAALGQVTSTIAGTSFVSPMSLGAGNLAAAGGGGFGGIGGAGGSAPVQITYNIPVTGDMSPQTVLYLKQQLQQHDQELITKLGAA
jgi:phage-related protein